MRDLTTPEPRTAPASSPAPRPSVLVWLWGNEPALARAEAAAVAHPAGMTGGARLVDGHPAVALTMPPGAWPVLTRLGLGRAVLRCLGWAPGLEPPFRPERVVRGSFAVRLHSWHAAPAARSIPPVVAPPVTAAALAAPVWRRLRAPRVDLVHPDTDLHVFATAEGFWWGRLLHAFDGAAFAARRPRARPFWRSVALGPRKARCLVNLSGVRPGGRLLDPFCGTGSIPIEAALLGVRAAAGDLDPAVLAGAAWNVAHAGVDVELYQRDARAWGAAGHRFDAVVADLPHGRTASLLGGERHELYRTFLEATARLLVARGRAVLMVEAGSLPPPPPGLVVRQRWSEVVHRGLTREVVVLHKTGG